MIHQAVVVHVPCKAGGLGVRLNYTMYLTTQPWAVHDSEACKALLLICNASGIHSGLYICLKAQRLHLQYKYLLTFKTWGDSSP